MTTGCDIPNDFLAAGESTRLRSIRFDEATHKLEILDQLLLPHISTWLSVEDTTAAWSVIRKMQVRGAPLIADVAALSLVVEAHSERVASLSSGSDVQRWFDEKREYLLSSRPTAVNLANRLSELHEAVRAVDTADGKRAVLRETAIRLMRNDDAENRQLIWNGVQLLRPLNSGKALRLMTICNTGSLATSNWGTALGVIRALHLEGRVEEVLALETRPYCQGIRLTAYELSHEKVPFRVISDGMAGWALRTMRVDAILVGADQVAMNGDTANKIGTYSLAVLARHHSVPFFPVLPWSTVNERRATGADIVVEERPEDELLCWNGKRVAPTGSRAWNPAFDVTPGSLITRLITERGCLEPAQLQSGCPPS